MSMPRTANQSNLGRANASNAPPMRAFSREMKHIASAKTGTPQQGNQLMHGRTERTCDVDTLPH
jgi:hypothetical protein